MTTTLDDLAWSVRRFLDVAVDSQAAGETLREVKLLVDAATARLSSSGRRGPGPIHTSAFRGAHSIVTGSSHPLAPPVALTITDGVAHGTLRLGKRYEGAPGLAHGGVLSLVLDHLFGEAAMAQQVGGMTVGLDLRFVAPTPLEVDLEVSCRVASVDGRKVHLSGAITHAGRPTVTATAVFVQLDAAKAAELFPTLAGS